MDFGLIALILLALIIGSVWLTARDYLRAVILGSILAMAASALATVIYFAIDYHELSLWPVLFAPVFEGAVIGTFLAAGFKLLSSRVRGMLLIPLVAAFGCASGYLLGMLLVGRSPHFSHDKATAALASSWLVVALIAASTYVLWHNTLLERTRQR